MELGRVQRPGWGPVGRASGCMLSWRVTGHRNRLVVRRKGSQRDREAAWLCRSRGGCGWIVFDAPGTCSALISCVPSRAAHEKWSEPPVPTGTGETDRAASWCTSPPASVPPWQEARVGGARVQSRQGAWPGGCGHRGGPGHGAGAVGRVVPAATATSALPAPLGPGDSEHGLVAAFRESAAGPRAHVPFLSGSL